MPSSETVKDYMKILILPPSILYTEDFFYAPLFPLVVLHDIAKSYGFGDIKSDSVEGLIVSDIEASNASVMTHAWFAALQDFTQADTRSVVDHFKRSRGSSNFPIRQSPSAADQPPIPIPRNQRPTPTHAPAVGVHLPQYIRFGVQAVPGLNGVYFNGASRSGNTVPDVEQRAGHSLSPPLSSYPTQYDDTRKAAYVNQCFKSRKFTGDMPQSIELALRDYDKRARQQKLTARQKSD